MTRMADPERPRDDHDYDDERFEDEGRRSIFSALWFRAILVVVVLGVVAAVAVPYVLELANQPPSKPTIGARPETPPPAAVAPAPASSATTPVSPPATERPAPAPPPPMAAPERPAAGKKTDASKSTVAKEHAASRPTKATATNGAAAPAGAYFVQVGAFKSQESAKRLATRLRELKY